MSVYKAGLLPYLHLLNPTGKRVKLKPVFQATNLHLPDSSQNTSMVVCYEVEKIGPHVTGIEVGMHVLHIAAAGDSADYKDLVICHEDEIIAWWYPPKE